MDNITHVGLDVHKESISVAIGEAGSRGAKSWKRLCNREEVIRRDMLEVLSSKYGKENLHFCYEAGPCGYGLYRYLKKLGYSVSVVAPSLIPRKPGEKVKTDRIDAKKLARYSRAGELTEVWVPDEKQEALRDLVRAREDARIALKRSKQNLGSFLLRHNRRFTSGKKYWTKTFFVWLAELRFEHTVQELALQDYIDTVERAQERIAALETELERAFEEWEWRPVVEALMALRGVSLLSAMVILTELGDLRRFKGARQLMSYVGLVPSEYSSGGRQTRGSLTKSGNAHVRRMLIEGAWCARLKPKKTLHWRRKAQHASEQVQAIAWKATKRLYTRYWRLSHRGLASNVVVTAIARELVGFIWDVAQEAYREQEQSSASKLAA